MTGRIICMNMLGERRVVDILDFEPSFDATRKYIALFIYVSLLGCRLSALGLLFEISSVEGRSDGYCTSAGLRYALLFFQVQANLDKHRR
jgi:hypothetical protein